jgi:hypothetical protein
LEAIVASASGPVRPASSSGLVQFLVTRQAVQYVRELSDFGSREGGGGSGELFDGGLLIRRQRQPDSPRRGGALALARFDQLLDKTGGPDFARNEVAARKRKRRNLDAAKYFRLKLSEGPSNAADLKLQRLGEKALVDDRPPHFDRHIAILLPIVGQRFVDIEPLHRSLERQLKNRTTLLAMKNPMTQPARIPNTARNRLDRNSSRCSPKVIVEPSNRSSCVLRAMIGEPLARGGRGAARGIQSLDAAGLATAHPEQSRGGKDVR